MNWRNSLSSFSAKGHTLFSSASNIYFAQSSSSSEIVWILDLRLVPRKGGKGWKLQKKRIRQEKAPGIPVWKIFGKFFFRRKSEKKEVTKPKFLLISSSWYYANCGTMRKFKGRAAGGVRVWSWGTRGGDNVETGVRSSIRGQHRLEQEKRSERLEREEIVTIIIYR